VLSSAGHAGEGGRRGTDGSTTSSARLAVEVRGCRSSRVVFFFPVQRPGLVLRIPHRFASAPLPFSGRRGGATLEVLRAHVLRLGRPQRWSFPPAAFRQRALPSRWTPMLKGSRSTASLIPRLADPAPTPPSGASPVVRRLVGLEILLPRRKLRKKTYRT
jgi:hypothetical protein